MSEIIMSHEGIDVIFFREGTSLKFVGIFPEKTAKKILSDKLQFEKLEKYYETELHCSGESQDEHHGSKFKGGQPGQRLVFNGFEDTTDKGNRKLILKYSDDKTGLDVESVYLFVKGAPVIRRWVTVTNKGKQPAGIEYIFSAVINGIGMGGTKSWKERMLMHIPYSSWMVEGQWKSGLLHEFGFSSAVTTYYGLNCFSMSQTGTWSTLNSLPMAVLQDKENENVWFWQIENNGSWYWELGELTLEYLYLNIGGPNEEKNHWFKNLKPGESFSTVTAAIGAAEGRFDDAIKHLTAYRRRICLREHEDNKNLPVIFNDYMHCLWADPTTEKELPLIDAAAKAGCEYFVIDAGWYADIKKIWWTEVGMWQENKDRFPGGMKKLIDAIKEKGMVPGIWLEIEVAGINSPLKDKPDSWFFMRHGKRVIDRGRFFLDFRNPEVIKHADEVIDRLVNDYGIGYFKIDYNISAKMGTETGADSFGDGLLQHNRAYLGWLDSVNKRYPKLVIENCSSGGLRMDYALLSKCQLQSSSDQTEYTSNPSIISGAMAGCLPEQLACWSYPVNKGDEEHVIFNFVNAMLGRIHFSGEVAGFSREKFEYVKQGIAVYKSYRKQIPSMTPFWPVGMLPVDEKDGWYSFGLKDEKEKFILLSVWRFENRKKEFKIPLGFLKGKKPRVKQVYPLDRKCKFSFNKTNSCLNVKLGTPMTARLLRIDY